MRFSAMSFCALLFALLSASCAPQQPAAPTAAQPAPTMARQPAPPTTGQQPAPYVPKETERGGGGGGSY